MQVITITKTTIVSKTPLIVAERIISRGSGSARKTLVRREEEIVTFVCGI